MTEPTLLPSKVRLFVTRMDKYNHNLSEGLPIINDTSAKMTDVVVF